MTQTVTIIEERLSLVEDRVAAGREGTVNVELRRAAAAHTRTGGAQSFMDDADEGDADEDDEDDGRGQVNGGGSADGLVSRGRRLRFQ